MYISQIKILNPKDVSGWNEEIQNLNNYSFFHSVEWSQVLSQTYHYKPVYFCNFNQDKICAVIPAMEIRSKLTGNRLVSLPFSDFCEPLYNSIEESELLKETIFNYCNSNELRFMEFRTSETKFPFETENFRTDLRHILDISVDESILYKEFSDNTKRNIKSAIKENIQIEKDNSFEAMNLFYHLQCVTRKRHGLPPQPKSFFKKIFEHIISKNKGDLLFAKLDNKTLAGLMFFKIGSKVLYKFGASLLENLPKGANHLLIWEGIKLYQKSGFKEFDFGRTETNHEGLRRFKLGFGADERIIYTTRYDIQRKTFLPPETNTTGIHNKIFRKLPLTLLRFIGETIYKQMG
ncbi:GNAT family N-acetyltransferase [Ignavibacterium sp.]|uniref:lipid II:glycine glycyltransferase FemX n=1 Tax=Ignavibacterium sp. TaxID=2651167 RepID=UPI00307E281A